MGNFTFIETGIPDMLIVETKVYGDERGYFMETYQAEAFRAAGINAVFVQDNQSKSRRGVLRGLHLQWQNTQGKLVRVTRGCVYDVGVDLRPNSPSFGKWAGAELSEENRRQLYVPPGFAHGFLVLSEEAEFAYKCTDLYNPAAEGGLRWNDPRIGITWPDAGVPPQLNGRDAALPLFDEQDFTAFERWYVD